MALVRYTVHNIKHSLVYMVLVSLDQEKPLMSLLMSKLGLGKLFCSYVNLLYLEIYSTALVKVCGTDLFGSFLGSKKAALFHLSFVFVLQSFCGVYSAE